MKTISELGMEFAAIKSKRMPRADKLPIVRAIRGGGVSDREGRRLRFWIPA